MDIITKFNKDSLVRTDLYYLVGDYLYVTRITSKDTVEDTLLAGNMSVGSKIQNLPYTYQRATVVSDNEQLDVLGSKLRVIKTEQEIDSGKVITNYLGKPIISNGNTLVKSYYSPGWFVVKQEFDTKLPPPYSSKWRSSQYTTVLRSVVKK